MGKKIDQFGRMKEEVRYVGSKTNKQSGNLQSEQR